MWAHNESRQAKPRQGRPILAQDEVLGTARKKDSGPAGHQSTHPQTPSIRELGCPVQAPLGRGCHLSRKVPPSATKAAPCHSNTFTRIGGTARRPAVEQLPSLFHRRGRSGQDRITVDPTAAEEAGDCSNGSHSFRHPKPAQAKLERGTPKSVSRPRLGGPFKPFFGLSGAVPAAEGNEASNLPGHVELFSVPRGTRPAFACKHPHSSQRTA